MPHPWMRVRDFRFLLMAVIDQYVSVTTEQCLFIALWILHTYIFDRRLFMHTPRLLVTGPVRGCGKSTLMPVAGSSSG